MHAPHEARSCDVPMSSPWGYGRAHRRARDAGRTSIGAVRRRPRGQEDGVRSVECLVVPPARVVAVSPESHAADAGLLAGDEIITVNGEDLRDVIRYQLQ